MRAREREAVWGYLRSRYDRDGNGRIERPEYDRGDAAFARLDRDGDGSIGRRDFDREIVPPPDLVVPYLLVRTFGPEDADSVGFDEIERGFARLDRDGDGRVFRGEFEAKSPRQGPDFFASLLAGIDWDGDGALALTEVKSFFERHDRDGDGLLGQMERSLPGRPPRVGAIPVAKREKAPDFTLARLRGEGTVTLSSFAGNRPVALVFGSFT